MLAEWIMANEWAEEGEGKGRKYFPAREKSRAQ